MAAMALAGCASTTWNSYPAGTVKYSQVKYNYTAKPVLSEPEGKTYSLETDEALSAITSVPALEKRGVTRADSGADVVLVIKSGQISHEPGSFGLSGSYQPALVSNMPIQIKVKDKGGNVILDRGLRHENIAVMSGAKKFKSRKEAKAAMTAITDLAKSSADNSVKKGAAGKVNKSLSLIAKDLFEPRDISVTLPAIRSAGDVDMEAAYTLLSEAEGDEQVKNALAAYAALGIEHQKADGSEDVVGIYGVLCGSASAKILAGDLAGAWQDTKQAWEIMSMGKEHRLIAKVLKQQQEQAGVEIIPKEDFDEMVSADKKAVKDQLKNLFGGKK
ncbi:MAG: hypothetical protein ACYTFI_15210 [Planctomycetota bacterium]|jgi:hypothetical protein